LRDGQSFALGGLLDNNETRTLSKVPGLGDIPILGNLFRSTQFQKSESELMFIVTAQTVKPVNRDDLPKMHGIDGLKNGSPLGVEPKSGEIDGPTGFIKSGSERGASGTPNAADPSAVSNAATAASPSSAGGTDALAPSVVPVAQSGSAPSEAKTTPNR
jgi:pilus assembly protein CpaC